MPSTPPPPLPPPIQYHSPTGLTNGPRRPVVDIPLLVLGMVFAALVTIAVMILLPRFEGIFRDFGVQLPAATVLLIKFGRICRAGALPLVWLITIAPAFLVPLVRPWPPADGRRRSSGLAFLLALLLFLILGGFMAFALFSPYVSLVNAVSGGSSGK